MFQHSNVALRDVALLYYFDIKLFHVALFNIKLFDAALGDVPPSNFALFDVSTFQ